MKTIILIPYYNNIKCLNKTLSSIMHTNGIDVLIVDDGSKDEQAPTLVKLKDSLNKNVSLEILRLNENQGIANALNYGLEHILKYKKHQFIARIDSGDVCVENRFEIQENYLIKNKEIDLVGSWVRWLDSEGKIAFCKKPPTAHKQIKKLMSVRCSLIHPSTMYRVSMVSNLGKYPTKFEAAEDYAYFFDIANKTKVANIPAFLTDVEYNEKGISVSRRKTQNKSKLKVILRHSPFNFYFLYGIIFNLCLMSVGTATILKMKVKIFKN